MAERLQKILSQWGIASRREAEQLILQGRVRLNGNPVQLGQKADPNFDHIEVDGRLVQPGGRPQLTYLLLNKPIGIVSTCKDSWNRTTVLDVLPRHLQQSSGIHPVGRLDAASTGALLLTNDGDVTFCLTHPRHQITKTYHVWVQGHPSASTLAEWRSGVMLAGRLTLPADVDVLEQNDEQTLLEIKLREGRNRQIRRVASMLGHPVVHLHRVAIGPIQLRQLSIGEYRNLSKAEIEFLHNQVEWFKHYPEATSISQ